MSQDQDERDAIRRADEYLTDHYGVVVDDVVLRSWGSQQPKLVQKDLTTAVADSGGVADPIELLPVATSIAFPDGSSTPWVSDTDMADAQRSSSLVDAARLLAGELLRKVGDGGRRWQHTQAVAARAAQAAHLFEHDSAEHLVAAAWLHDIGYSQQVNRHDFHPVDGAEHINEQLTSPEIAGLVAHHSGARFVAQVRGLGHLLRPFANREYWTGPLADALTWADQTTGPDGQRVTLDERLNEMLTRHGPDSPNARSNDLRAPALRRAVHATENRLHQAGRREVGRPGTASS